MKTQHQAIELLKHNTHQITVTTIDAEQLTWALDAAKNDQRMECAKALFEILKDEGDIRNAIVGYVEDLCKGK